MKQIIEIEEKDFKNRQEFKIKITGNYPKFLNRKGKYIRYLSRWVNMGDISGEEEYIFIAYKKNGWFTNLFGNDYRNQCRIAIQNCDKLINNYKKNSEKPKITNYER